MKIKSIFKNKTLVLTALLLTLTATAANAAPIAKITDGKVNTMIKVIPASKTQHKTVWIANTSTLEYQPTQATIDATSKIVDQTYGIHKGKKYVDLSKKYRIPKVIYKIASTANPTQNTLVPISSNSTFNAIEAIKKAHAGAYTPSTLVYTTYKSIHDE